MLDDPGDVFVTQLPGGNRRHLSESVAHDREHLGRFPGHRHEGGCTASAAVRSMTCLAYLRVRRRPRLRGHRLRKCRRCRRRRTARAQRKRHQRRIRTSARRNRHELAPNHGMLFVFDTAEKACMWMRNTLIPLSVAFIDFDGSVVNIEDMEPRTEQPHCALRPVPYALEMTRGWFSERGLQPAQTVIGRLPPAPVSAKK